MRRGLEGWDSLGAFGQSRRGDDPRKFAASLEKEQERLKRREKALQKEKESLRAEKAAVLTAKGKAQDKVNNLESDLRLLRNNARHVSRRPSKIDLSDLKVKFKNETLRQSEQFKFREDYIDREERQAVSRVARDVTKSWLEKRGDCEIHMKFAIVDWMSGSGKSRLLV